MHFDYAARRQRLAESLQVSDAIVLIGAGCSMPKPELSDQRFPFIAHQEYYYLTGLANAEGGILAYDPKLKSARSADAGWISFVPSVTESERIWEAKVQLPGERLDIFTDWLDARATRPVVMLGTPVEGIEADWELTATVRASFLHARRKKEPPEIDLMRHCAYKTASGYAAVVPMIKAGFNERRIQVEIEAEYLRRGATRTGYDTIVGSGPNSAVLHAAPSARTFREGDFVLIDSGAEMDRYVIDVTRTYVVGHASQFQRDLYQVVLNAQLNAIARCMPGTEWKAIHLAAAFDLVEGLVSLGVMIGHPHTLVERDAHTLFFPHGIGHMVGLGVRDASGLEPGRSKDPRPSLSTLRMDLILRAGYLVTVEPGLYFIPALLTNPANREHFADCVNWPLVDKCLHLGGVRLEDTLLVNPGPPEILTRIIPKVL